MNRRGFLSLAAAAPVALPMAASAATRGYATGGYLSGEIVGFDFGALDSVSVGYFRSVSLDPRDVKHIASRRFSVNEIVKLPLSVEQQMIEHDLFDFSAERRSAA